MIDAIGGVGSIGYVTDFAGTLATNRLSAEDRFKALDADSSGGISRTEFGNAVGMMDALRGQATSAVKIVQDFRALDENADGQVSLDEGKAFDAQKAKDDLANAAAGFQNRSDMARILLDSLSPLNQQSAFGILLQNGSYQTGAQNSLVDALTSNDDGWGSNPTAYGWNSTPTAYGWNPNPTAYGWNSNPTAYGWNSNPTAYGWGSNPTTYGFSSGFVTKVIRAYRSQGSMSG